MFSEVQCRADCAFFSSLEQLMMASVSVSSFHANGLSVCSRLQSLHLASAVIQAASVGDLVALCDNKEPVQQPISAGCSYCSQHQLRQSRFTFAARLAHSSYVLAGACIECENTLSRASRRYRKFKQLTTWHRSYSSIKFDFLWTESIAPSFKTCLYMDFSRSPRMGLMWSWSKALKHVNSASTDFWAAPNRITREAGPQIRCNKTRCAVWSALLEAVQHWHTELAITRSTVACLNMICVLYFVELKQTWRQQQVLIKIALDTILCMGAGLRLWSKLSLSVIRWLARWLAKWRLL